MRSLDYFLNTQAFEYYYDSLTKEERSVVDSLILDCVNLDVEKRINSRVKLGSIIEKQSVIKLKHRAQQLGIPNYSRMNKATLITEF